MYSFSTKQGAQYVLLSIPLEIKDRNRVEKNFSAHLKYLFFLSQK